MITHQIADIIYRTESDTNLPIICEEPFKMFRIDNIKPDVYLQFHKVDTNSLTMPLPSGKEKTRLLAHTYGWPGRLANPILRSPIVRAKLQECIKRTESVRIQLYYNWVIIYDFDNIKTDFYYSSEASNYPAEYYVAGRFPRVFSFFLPIFSGILLHSSGIIRNDKAAIFIGASGMGKSTVVEHSINMPVLNDDLIILRKKDNSIIAYATPLAKKTTGPCQARLGGLFMLEQAKNFKLIPIKPQDMIQCLWTAYSKDTEHYKKSLKKRTFSVICDICYQFPIYHMHFPKDYVDWDAIDRAMQK